MADSTTTRVSGSPAVSAAGYTSKQDELPEPPVTEWPGVMHTGAQSVVRDGVQVLTDCPQESDDPVPGRHFTFMPTVW